MIKQTLLTAVLIFLAPLLVTQASASSSDLDTLKACFLTPGTGACEAADFNKDGAVNFADLGLFKSVTASHDFNKDSKIDWYEETPHSDLLVLKECFFTTGNEACSATDINTDGAVNFADLGLFKAVTINHDLNGDGVVNWGDGVGSDLDALKACFLTAGTESCAKADFNKDGAVNFADLGLFKSVTASHDFNKDNKIDWYEKTPHSDLLVLKECFFGNGTGACAATDLNGDGAVNFADLGLLKAVTVSHDLNGDGIINWSDNTPEQVAPKTDAPKKVNEVVVQSESDDSLKLDTPSVEKTTSPAESQETELKEVIKEIVIKKYNFNRNLWIGLEGEDVKEIQKKLNTDADTRVAVSGDGSVGNETGYYGKLTERAVQKFQCKHSIVCSGTPETTGFGAFGPKTQSKFTEVFESSSVVDDSVASSGATSKVSDLDSLRSQIEVLQKAIEALKKQISSR